MKFQGFWELWLQNCGRPNIPIWEIYFGHLSDQIYIFLINRNTAVPLPTMLISMKAAALRTNPLLWQCQTQGGVALLLVTPGSTELSVTRNPKPTKTQKSTNNSEAWERCREGGKRASPTEVKTKASSALLCARSPEFSSHTPNLRKWENVSWI